MADIEYAIDSLKVLSGSMEPQNQQFINELGQQVTEQIKQTLPSISSESPIEPSDAPLTTDEIKSKLLEQVREKLAESGLTD